MFLDSINITPNGICSGQNVGLRCIDNPELVCSKTVDGDYKCQGKNNLCLKLNKMPASP